MRVLLPSLLVLCSTASALHGETFETPAKDLRIEYDPAVWSIRNPMKVPEWGKTFQAATWMLEKRGMFRITAASDPSKRDEPSFKKSVTQLPKADGSKQRLITEGHEVIAGTTWYVVEVSDPPDRLALRERHYFVPTKIGHVRISVMGRVDEFLSYSKELAEFWRGVHLN